MTLGHAMVSAKKGKPFISWPPAVPAANRTNVDITVMAAHLNFISRPPFGMLEQALPPALIEYLDHEAIIFSSLFL
jgi:hypothetical protein